MSVRTIYSVLFDLIDEHRKAAGRHTLAERRDFVEGFAQWKTVGGETGYHPRLGWADEIRSWAENVFSGVIDDTTTLGRGLIGGLLAGLEDDNDPDDGVEGDLLADILEVAEEVAADLRREALTEQNNRRAAE